MWSLELIETDQTESSSESLRKDSKSFGKSKKFKEIQKDSGLMKVEAFQRNNKGIQRESGNRKIKEFERYKKSKND